MFRSSRRREALRRPLEGGAEREHIVSPRAQLVRFKLIRLTVQLTVNAVLRVGYFETEEVFNICTKSNFVFV